MSPSAADVIRSLKLQPHPEGGFYRETFRSEVSVPAHGGERAAMTSILFLLRAGEESAWHRVRSDELWLHQGGDDLTLWVDQETVRLGGGPGNDLQGIVPAGAWQRARAVDDGVHGYALVGCVVAPGFDFADFELGDGPT